MAKELELYTLYVEGTAIAICALETEALEKDMEGTIRGAIIETWQFGGGDPMHLVGRTTMARPATKREIRMWRATASATGKPFVVLAGGGEARGRA